MPSTNFPKGVSVSTAMRTTDGEMYSETLVTSGAASVGGALTVGGAFSIATAGNGFVGEVIAIPVSFGTGSAAQTVAVPGAPFAGSIVGCYVTIGSVSAIASQYTVQIGSNGAVSVASVTNTNTDAYSKQSLATTETVFTVNDAFKCVRANQGTAGDSYLTLLVKRTV
jgi:hypothetical protein